MKTYLYLSLALCISSLFTTACSSHYGLDKEKYKQSQSDAKAFWSWFEGYEEELRKHLNDSSKAQLATALNMYKRGISFLIHPTNDDMKELIISGGGNRELIPYIEILHANKPHQLNKWHVTAFMQMQEIPEQLHYASDSLSTEDFSLCLWPEDQQLHVLVGLKKSDFAKPEYKALVHNYLLHSLGEYKLMTNIGQVKIDTYDALPEKMDQYSIYDLRREFQLCFPE